MMTLDEVLSLEEDKKSIKKIDMFLRDKEESSYEFLKAIAFKCHILHISDKDKDALRILLPLTSQFKNYDNDSIISLCDSLIEIFLYNDNNDQALKYIDIKNEHLKTIDKDKYLYDMIKYYDNVSNRIELKRTITQYLGEDISNENRISALEKLKDLLFYDNEFDNFFDAYNKLLSFYEKSFSYEKIFKLKTQMAQMYFQSYKYDLALSFISEFIKDKNIDIDSKIKCATIVLKIYLLNKENRKAMIFESEYHDIYEGASKGVALEFARTALKVSEAIANRFGIEEYEAKINELNEAFKAEKKDLKKEKRKSINLNIIEDEISPDNLDNDTIHISYKKGDNDKSHFTEVVSNIEETPIMISERFKSLEGVLSALNPNKGVRFRDILRNYGMEIDKLYSKVEIVIVLNNNREGFYYKVERVYEKNFSDSVIKDSPFYELLNNSDKMLLLDVKQSLFDKSIITGLPFEDKFKSLIGFSLFRNDKVIGAITYNFMTTEFKDIYIYETLKMLTSVLNIHINELYDSYDRSHENKMHDFIFAHSKSGLKIERDKEIELNETAKSILDVRNKFYEDSEYMALIDASDLPLYKGTYRRIYEREIKEATIYYHIKGKYLKEDIMVLDDAVLEIYSIITDESGREAIEKDLENKAYNNQISHLKNKSMLYIDLMSEIETKKYAIALISNKNYNTYFDIYGYKFADDLTLLIGRILKDMISKDMDCYHLENDKFMLLFKQVNDLRGIKTRVSNILTKIKEIAYKTNPRLHLSLKAGVFRYTKSMGNVDYLRAISNASEALLDAYDSNDMDVMIYDKDRALERFRDSQIILYCTEAIDQNELKLNYKQMANADEGTIEYYIPRPNLLMFDCDEKYFYDVVEKRNIKKMFDRYIITTALFELKTFYDKCKVYYPLLISIHKSVLLDKRFKTYLEQKLKYFHIPPQVLSFNIIEDTTKSSIELELYLKTIGVHLASSSFDYCVRNKLNIYLCDLNIYSFDTIKALKKSLDSLDILMYGLNIKSKDDITKLHEIGVDVICGDILKQNDTIDSLIKSYNALS